RRARGARTRDPRVRRLKLRRPISRASGERALDRLLDLGRRRLGGRVEARDDVALLVDDELREVPLDVARRLGTDLLLGQPGVERGARVTVHVDLREHREGDAVLEAAELLDLGV